MASVLVHIDLDGEVPDASSLAALAAGRVLASAWGASLVAAAITDAAAVAEVGPVLRPIVGRAGADRLVLAATTVPAFPLWAVLGGAWLAVVEQVRPRVILFGADAPSAGELAPRTAARLGARLLWRARAVAGDQMELRDRDGAYVRASDSGAAVALVAAAPAVWRLAAGAPGIPVQLLAPVAPRHPGIVVAGTTPAVPAQVAAVVVALAEEAGRDGATRAGALALARTLGAPLLDGARTDRHTPLAPELCILIGGEVGEIAGGTAVVRIGGPASGTGDDGTLDGPTAITLTELVAALAGLAGPAGQDRP